MPRIPRLRKELPQAPEAAPDQETEVSPEDGATTSSDPPAGSGIAGSGDPLAAPRPTGENITTSGDPLAAPRPVAESITTSGDPLTGGASAPAAPSVAERPTTGGDEPVETAMTVDDPVATTSAEPETTVEEPETTSGDEAATAASGDAVAATTSSEVASPASDAATTAAAPGASNGEGGVVSPEGATAVMPPAAPTGQDSATVVEEAPADAAPGFRQRARIRRRLRYLRRYRELAFRDLGGLVFDLHRFGRERPDLVTQKLDGLSTVDQELRALETALRERQDVAYLREAGVAACPRCDTLHDTDANFCPGCGTAFRGAVVRDAAHVSVAPAQQQQAQPQQPEPQPEQPPSAPPS